MSDGYSILAMVPTVLIKSSLDRSDGVKRESEITRRLIECLPE